jgi:glucose-6-phosphate isomerase
MNPVLSINSANSTRTQSLTSSVSWRRLEAHFKAIESEHMVDMFAADPQRFERFSIQFEDILLDFSKNRINEETFNLLMNLASERDVPLWRELEFSGEKINTTEKRAVLHTALRNQSDRPVLVDGVDVMPAVRQELEHMRTFAAGIHSGEWKGFSGKKITDVVNIGIGGSDMGPSFVSSALKPYQCKGITPHFVSNVDCADIANTLGNLDPESTLFIISSKTFTTQETITNAWTARDWLLSFADSEDAVAKHFVAVSANEKAVAEFGIQPENMFRFWDWVGGRYSVWSTIGLPVVLAIGMENFVSLLEGANAMDKHFLHSPLEHNMPVIMAMLGIWYINFFKAGSHAVLPYCEYLVSFPDYLQQADMESNGKSVDRDGNKLDYDTGPIVWGKAGTNGQHAFYQQLHQGTRLLPADFIAPVQSPHLMGDHQQKLLANFFAQTEALMKGRTPEEAGELLSSSGLSDEAAQERLPFVVFKGNVPTNSLLFKALSPRTLGSLLALYEHKIFVQGVIWGIDSFDQWGVELGKTLAEAVLPELQTRESTETHDSSTNGLINYCKSLD